MINILCNADRTWQICHFGYGFQTHSLADLIAEPPKRIIKAFCQCRRQYYETSYKVKGLSGMARECNNIVEENYCGDCGSAIFFTHKFHAITFSSLQIERHLKG